MQQSILKEKWRRKLSLQVETPCGWKGHVQVVYLQQSTNPRRSSANWLVNLNCRPAGFESFKCHVTEKRLSAGARILHTDFA